MGDVGCRRRNVARGVDPHLDVVCRANLEDVVSRHRDGKVARPFDRKVIDSNGKVRVCGLCEVEVDGGIEARKLELAVAGKVLAQESIPRHSLPASAAHWHNLGVEAAQAMPLWFEAGGARAAIDRAIAPRTAASGTNEVAGTVGVAVAVSLIDATLPLAAVIVRGRIGVRVVTRLRHQPSAMRQLECKISSGMANPSRGMKLKCGAEWF
eukprot:1504194-Rhodomonas_salina.1